MIENYFKLGIVIPYYKTGRLREVLMKELVENLKAQIYGLETYLKVCIYEDVEFNDNYLRDKLTETYYIDTVYHYNFGIDKKCLSYQAQIERGDRLHSNR